jgi:hypothetical protein
MGLFICGFRVDVAYSFSKSRTKCYLFNIKYITISFLNKMVDVTHTNVELNNS